MQGLVSRCRAVLRMFIFVSRCYNMWLWLCSSEVMEAGDKLREALEGRNAANIDHLRRKSSGCSAICRNPLLHFWIFLHTKMM